MICVFFLIWQDEVNILFIHYDPGIREEIDEFLLTQKGTAFFANNSEDAIRILNDTPIGLVVLKINNMRDAAVLKYINDYYHDLEVYVMATKEYDDIISVFSKGRYKMFPQPLKLSELKKNIEEGKTIKNEH